MGKVIRLDRVELRLTLEESAKLDACANLAKLDRSKLLRHLVEIAYQDMVCCFPDRAIRPTDTEGQD
jgi:hypothetical protein